VHEDDPTRMLPPTPRRSAPVQTPPPPELNVSITTPGEAMRNDEVERFRRLGFPAIVVTVGGLLAVLPSLPGEPSVRRMFAVAIAIYGAAAVWFRLQIRDPRNFNDNNLLVLGLAGAIAGAGAFVYWGVFSPAPIVVAAAVYVNCLDGGLRTSTIIFAACSGAELVVALAIITGLIHDPGLIRADSATLLTQIVTQITIQGAFVLAYVGGRITRKVTFDSVRALDRAAREAAKREALIDEIRQDLRRAAGGAAPGRFTEQVVGSFKLGMLIGRGGTGEVYDARHVTTGARAAVKMLQLAHLADDRVRERFAREARAATTLASPHVVAILEFRAEPGQLPFLAMERLEGNDLAQLLQQRRQLPLDEVCELVDQLAAGLELARTAGIVHRDLKPHNVFLTDTQTWKILDFGVSKLSDNTGSLTEGIVLGTPAYMAPEQARGDAVDHRADVYGLGAIAYRALTGKPPFPSGELAQTIHRLIATMPARPGTLASIDSGVEAVLALALCKLPAARIATALEFAAALRAAADGHVDAELLRRAEQVLAVLPWTQV
jgi:tRNA A-37 threonylcarbamoyl transferase component Bud32